MVTFNKRAGRSFSATPYANGVNPDLGDSTPPDDARLGCPNKAHDIANENKANIRIINRSGCQLTRFDLKTTIIFLTDSRYVC